MALSNCPLTQAQLTKQLAPDARMARNLHEISITLRVIISSKSAPPIIASPPAVSMSLWVVSTVVSSEPRSFGGHLFASGLAIACGAGAPARQRNG
jgi:hypothetical protein